MAVIDAWWPTNDPGDVWAALSGLLEKPAWHRGAACKEHPELSWFPSVRVSIARQVAICDACLVRDECAASGEAEEHGIWAGVSAHGRKVQRRTKLAA